MMENSNDIEAIKKLLVLQLRYQGVPDELIAKASGMNAKSIRNMFPLGKRKKGDDSGKKKEKS